MARDRSTIVGALLAALALVATPAAEARQDTVESFDGTPIVANFFPGDGASAKRPAPSIMVGPGWTGRGQTDPRGGTIAPFIRAGYNVLTWDPRGFGGSGGTVQFNDPRYEGRDVSRLIDHVAGQREALKDGPRNPRLGMAGASYGGAIQLVAAAIDRRIDAIAPALAWNSLVSGFFRSGDTKVGWSAVIAGGGAVGAAAQGVGSPAGPQIGGQDPMFYEGFATAIATGRPSERSLRWFRSKGPDFLLRRIKAPTLLIQGTVDTLLTLDEAVANHRALRRNRMPLRMMFFCGGHGVCFTDDGNAGRRITIRTLAWFERHLRGERGARVGPRFEWATEGGRWRGSKRYPPRPGRRLGAVGSGELALGGTTSGASSGEPGFARPSSEAVEVEIPGRRRGLDVVGKPRLRLAYRGSAVPERTFAYAQILAPGGRHVVGNQATPLPLRLDGRARSLDLALETIASRLPRKRSYTLQLIPQSAVYGAQRSTGSVRFEHVRITLPARR